MKAQQLLEQLSNIADDITIKVSIEYSTGTDESELFINDTNIDNDLKTIFLLNDELNFIRTNDE
tara:strand:- start:257 stop:448 length:192 start_codon:yes stop_codon:yes gene_type:complete